MNAIGLRAGALGLSLSPLDHALGLALGLHPQPLRDVMGLGENPSGFLAHPLELAPDDVVAALVGPARLEPLGETCQEPVYLALVVAATGHGERRAANPLDAVSIHASSCRRRQEANRGL